MKNHLEPITKRALANYKPAPATGAKEKHVNFTNAGDCGCMGKCDC
jgi:hypothetical protein